MDQQSSSARFWSEFRALRDAAGRPPLKAMVRLAQEQDTPVKVADSTISDWLNGKAIPSAGYTDYVLALVCHLHIASGQPWTQVYGDCWSTLLTEARAEQDQLRGVRRPDSGPEPALPRPPDTPPLLGRARRHLFFKIGSSAGTKFDMIPPIARSHPSEALTEFLAALERIGIPPHQLDPIRARAADVAAAPPGERFVAAVFAFAAAVDGVTDALRECSVGDEFDWFLLADLIGRIFLIVRAIWPEDPSLESETLRASLYALGGRLDVPASVRSEIQGFATMKLPTATIDEFTSAAIRLQELCYRLL